MENKPKPPQPKAPQPKPPQPKPTQPHHPFDHVMKEIFVPGNTSILQSLAGNQRIVEAVNTDLREILAYECDSVFRLDDGSLLHVEFVGRLPQRILTRAAIYGALLSDTYQCVIRQVLLYIGAAPLHELKPLQVAGHTFYCQLVDIRDFEAQDLIDSGVPGDLALSILANNGGALLRQALQKLQQLPADLRRRTLRYLLFLAGLRPQISTILKKELAMMPTVFDELNLSENVFFQDLYKAAIAEGIAEGTLKGKAEGKAEGLEEGQRMLLHRLLTRKFAPLPQWATDRLNAATAPELELWSERLLTATSLEETLS
jgi:hypothetical protein